MNTYGRGLGGIVMALWMVGCGDDGAAASSSSGSGGGGSGDEGEAQKQAAAEIERHWSRNGDGWMTYRTVGSAYAPEHVVRQCKDIVAKRAETYQLSGSDKLNGFEWAGEVEYRPLTCREIGDSWGVAFDGIVGNGSAQRQQGVWTQWYEITPDPVKLQKLKGTWQFGQDTWLLRGTKPGSAELAATGAG